MVDFSVFEYCYRDAANYKVYGQLLLKGSVSIADTQKLQTRRQPDFKNWNRCGLEPNTVTPLGQLNARVCGFS